LDKDYPKPIVDFKSAYKNAQDQLWKLKNSNENKFQAKGILKKHASRSSSRRRRRV
jgi:deoxyribodipyrimidine photo-lyase